MAAPANVLMSLISIYKLSTFPACTKKPSGLLFAIRHHANTSYISSPRSGDGERGGWRLQSGCCSFFFLLISAVNIGVRAARPSPQDPPPSAPATASTSAAAMHEAHNLQDVSLSADVCVWWVSVGACIYIVCGGACFDMYAYVCVHVPAGAAMPDSLRRACWWQSARSSETQIYSQKQSIRRLHVIFITSLITPTVCLPHSIWI